MNEGRWFTMTLKVDVEARDPEEAKLVCERVHDAVHGALGGDRAWTVQSSTDPEEVFEP